MRVSAGIAIDNRYYTFRNLTTTLRRELGLRDVTLFAIVCIVGTRWITVAAHAGPGSVALWILGAIFLVAPLSIAVGALTAKYPGAGGLYLWTRNDFGPWHGFLCFWAYWIQIALWFPGAAMFYLSSVSGPLAANRFFLVGASLAVIWLALGTNMIGVGVGKWTENAGAIACWVLVLVLLAAAIAAGMRSGSATPIDIAPKVSWQSLNLWGVIAFAMSGLEFLGFMAGEIRDPERTVPRAGWVASVFITVFYIAATVSLLVLLPPENVSELHGLSEAGSAAGKSLGASWITPFVGFLVLLSSVGQFGGIGAAVSRMPYAAGVDHLLPVAFAKLHPRWATPYWSMLALGAASSVLLILAQVGDSLNAAYQALVSLMVIVGFFPYVYLFGSAWKAGKRASAVCGWSVTAIAILCSVAPTEEIHDLWAFEAKLAGGTLATLGTAWLLYRRGVRKRLAENHQRRWKAATKG